MLDLFICRVYRQSSKSSQMLPVPEPGTSCDFLDGSVVSRRGQPSDCLEYIEAIGSRRPNTARDDNSPSVHNFSTEEHVSGATLCWRQIALMEYSLMDIELILDSDWDPQQVAEIAVEAEKAGVRTIWHSNITNTWDPFIGLVPAALATSKIKLGVLAISPYEMHPLKIANAILSLNELANGRAIVALGGGGAVALNIVDDLDFKKMRIVRGVREAAEIIYLIASGNFYTGYPGQVFKLTKPSRMKYCKAPRPRIFTCSMGPQMLRMGGRIADGLQVGDVPPGRMEEVMEDIQAGLSQRQYPADDFRISNFWAWHIKKDRDASMHEARCQLFARAEVIRPNIGLEHVCNEAEAQIVKDNFMSFMMANITRSGEIKDVPESLVEHLIKEVSSAGDFGDIDREVERYREFEKSGLTDLALRIFDDPMGNLKTIKERVMPHFT
jgi:5,10-methylenetetrahydromethanopterin reductase